jgi:hypothetical protein
MDLFGNRVPIEQPKRKRGQVRKPTQKVTVAVKITWKEYQRLTAIANKFGMSVSRYCRDAVKQTINDHECILAPEHQWPTS